MYKILHKEALTRTVNLFEIESPAIARKAQPGQFVMLMVEEDGERIPLTIADWNRERGSISIVVSAVGATTGKLSKMGEGDSVPHFVGPLGVPATIGKFGDVACVTTGYGKVTAVPIARALREAGNKVHSVISAATRDDLFGMDRLANVSDDLTVTTSDGSYGERGWVIEPLRRMLGGDRPLNMVFTIGSICAMRQVAMATKRHGIKTMVSLNPIMVDGTGMCGACRVSIGGCTKFACVDGPEFDGHEVDWDLLQARRCTYPVPLDEASAATRCDSCGQW